MTGAWIVVMTLLVARTFVLPMIPSEWFLYGACVINFGILVIAYILFRREGRHDFRGTMLFLFGLTVVNLLIDVGMMSYGMSWVAFGALLVWSAAGGGKTR